MTQDKEPNKPGGPAWHLERPLAKVYGGTRVKPFNALGLTTVEDLLRHFPRRYEEPGKSAFLMDLHVGEHVTVMAKVARASVRSARDSRLWIVSAQVTDDIGTTVDLTFFYRNRAKADYQAARLKPGRWGLFTGTVTEYRGRFQLTHPDLLLPDDTAVAMSEALREAGHPIPIYPGSASLPTWRLHAAITTLLEQLPLDDLPDPIDQAIRAEENLLPLPEALRRIHRPAAMGEWRPAWRRFRFEEAFTAQVALARRRAGTAALRATPRPLLPPERAANSVLAAFDRRIPFALTGAQVRVGQVLAAHLSGASPMQRLLQGDVGSGKTVVALRAMLQTVDAGGQAVLLAPTEILAVQHYQTLSNLLGPLSGEGLFAPEAAPGGEVPAADAGPQGSDGAPRGVVVRLLTGSLGAAQRRSTLADLAEGRADIAIGTHALLSEPVGFADLGLVVIDEQHRFGVEQRDVLRSRGAKPPHVLVMTATPIPRSIAMTYFGDLETVTLDELPGGRPPVTTHVVPTSKPKWVARAWERIGEEARSGHGVFVVCPRIDAQDRTDPEGAPPAAGSDGSKAARPPTPSPDLENGSGPGGETQRPPLATVEDTLERIRREPGLRDLRSEAIHGRLSAEAKEQIMSSFASGQIDVLVATTVIEVGVDVPRATLMVVLDADRFGLAALHQLRGRIGRGRDPGVCLLVSGAEPETPAARRLAAMEQHRDGFKLSEIDLELRREGDVLGADQSGRGKSLRLLRVIRDRDLIAHTRFIAIDLIAGDPRLLGHPDLADFLARRLGDREDFLERA